MTIEKSKIKWIKDDEYITIVYPKKEGGPITIYKDNRNYKLLSDYLESDSIFVDIVKSLEIGASDFLKLTYKEKVNLVRKSLNEKMDKDIDVALKVKMLYEIYKLDGENPKRIRNHIVVQIMKTLLSDEKVVETVNKIIVKHEKKYIKTFISHRDLIEKNFKGTNVKIVEGLLYYKDQQIVRSKIINHIVESILVGIKPIHYINFLENVFKNPNKDIRDEMYDFLENGIFPIHSDGTFSAYKKIGKDWKDIYTRTIDHSIGKKPTMKRSEVDFNREKTCSRGLHFCAREYLGHYGSSRDYRIVEVKINPKDVAAIPKDYDNQKGRALTYEVIRELKQDEELELKEVAIKF